MELLPRRHGIAAGRVDLTRTTPYPLRRFTPLRAAGTWRLVSALAMPRPHGDAQPLEVLVYCGDGAGYNSSRNTLAAVQRHLASGIQARFLTTEELLEGAWPQRCLLLVMPGGADLPYCKHLNGRGNQLIKSFVAAGGSYLGICAGAYYACQRVEFEPGTALEVVGERELGFFPGTARGAAYPGFDYLTERGACAAPLRFRETPYGVPCIPTTTAAAVTAVTTDTGGRTAATMEPQSAAGLLGGGHEQAAASAVPRLGRRHLMFPGEGAEGPGVGSAAAGRDARQLGGASAESEARAVGVTGAALQQLTASPCKPAGAVGDGGDGGGGIDCADGASVRQGLLESGAAEEGQPEVERQRSVGDGCRTSSSSGSSSGGRGGCDGDGDGASNGRRLRGDAQDSSCSSSSGRSSGGDRGCSSLTGAGEYNGSSRRRRRRPGLHPRMYSKSDGDGCDSGTDGDFGGAHRGWVYCKDYSNGGPVFVPSVPPPAAAEEGAASLSTPSGGDTGGKDRGAGGTLAGSVSYETLAVYPGLGNSLAAVRCTVGAGVAVLCGTHPEMPYEALVGSALLYETAHAQHVAALGAELAVWERQRRQFWQVLLLACCTAAGQAATAAPPASTSRVAVSESVEAAKGSLPSQVVLEVAGRV